MKKFLIAIIVMSVFVGCVPPERGRKIILKADSISIESEKYNFQINVADIYMLELYHRRSLDICYDGSRKKFIRMKFNNDENALNEFLRIKSKYDDKIRMYKTTRWYE